MNEIQDPLNHKFPPEIVSHIFTLCLPQVPPLHRQGKIQEEWAAPLFLGAICRKWRHIAWSTPRLWTTVVVRVSSRTAKQLGGSLPQLVTEWLGRSGMLPLTIQFSAARSREQKEGYDEVKSLACLIIDVLNRHSECWQNLDLHFDVDTYTKKFHGSSELSHNLRRLSFNFHGVVSGLDLLVFLTEIRPTYLTLSCFHLSFTGFNVSWKNITHIILQYTDAITCVDVAEKAHRLQVFRVCAICTSPEEQIYVRRPSLRSLEFDEQNCPVPVPVAQIIDYMELPCLEEWSYMGKSWRIPLVNLLSLLERSSCHLKVVKISALDPSCIDDFRAFLEAIPSLEHLSFSLGLSNGQSTLNNILDRLCNSVPSGTSMTESASQFLPHLRTSDIGANNVPFSWDRVLAIFRSSNRGSLSMKFTFLNIHIEQIEDVVAHQLLQLVDEGRNLCITRKDVKELDFIQELRESAVRSGLYAI
jgi:hypothetical protein